MYIWSLKRLKADLLGAGLTDREILPYLIIVLVGVSAAFVAVPQHNFWSLIYGLVMVGSIIGTTMLAYYCNGGAEGRDFLSRFFSIAVVCAVRWALMFVAPLTAIAVMIPGTVWKLSFPGDPDRPLMGAYDVVMLVLMAPPLFWRIALQMRDLARQRPEREEVDVRHDGIALEPLED